ncbi:MAG TPA: thioredoxin family protein [Longimicrobiales bacterium]|nr:thioredoxin family protein [Longimicrobiales bacterium]
MTLDRARFAAAPTFLQYLERVDRNRELWRGVYERARAPEDLVAKARAIRGAWKLVALSEDWCGDAVNTLPSVARLVDAAGWELRVLSRDANPDLMDAHLTNGRSRSIPVVIVYDESFREVGWWGPRPEEIQSWVLGEGLAIPSPERYKVVRRWYARDKGRTTLSELLEVFPRAA